MKGLSSYLLFVGAVGCTTVTHGTGASEESATSPAPDARATTAGEDPAAPQRSSPSSSASSGSSSSSSSSSPSASADDAGSSDAGTSDGAGGGLPPIVPDAMRVFETSKGFTGDLKTEGGGATGAQGADNLCAGAALAAGLGGTWKAWISAPGEDAADRIADRSPWYLVDRRTKVFDTKVGLAQGSVLPGAPGVSVGPLVEIRTNEHGVVNSPTNDWTGTTKTGAASAFTCNAWTNADPLGGDEGLVGIGIDFDITWWTDSVTNPCRLANRLICFEQ